MSEQAESTVLRLHRGRVGHIVLNRPRVINALDHGMVLAVRRALDEWRDDPGVELVVITGAGERGLCAGGDVRAMAAGVRSGRPEVATTFLRDEYRMNATIGSWPKPVVAILDGITMGGGIGVGGHASTRVVTERSVLAMPEARIGFAPDVGGTLLLSRMPGRLGEHLAMTASTMTGADAVATGFADSFVPSPALPGLLAALEDARGEDQAAVLARFAVPAPASTLLEQREWIDDAYAGASAVEIVAHLESHPDERARQAAATIRTLSPLAVCVALEAVRVARGLPDLRSALEQEWRTAAGMVAAGDFLEGVRAQLVDKDRSPRWSPPRIEDVGPERVREILATAPPLPLWDRR